MEKDVLEADVPGDRSQVPAAGQEVVERRLLRHLVDAAVVLAGDPGGVSLPQLADRQRRARQLDADLGAPGLVIALDRTFRRGVSGARVE